MREIAKRYKALRDELQRFSSGDPDVNRLAAEAAKALEAGEFERAEGLLDEASERDLEAARRLEEAADKRLLSAAASKARNGDLKFTQLAYGKAAAYYREAAALLPSDALTVLAVYLNRCGRCLTEAADYRNAEEPLRRALAIREKALGPEHPDVATSLNNLAWLYQAEGKYAEAEPLYRRALAIRERGEAGGRVGAAR